MGVRLLVGTAKGGFRVTSDVVPLLTVGVYRLRGRAATRPDAGDGRIV